MYKSKLCGFAIACIVGFVGMFIFPITTLAAETNTEAETKMEKNQTHKERKAAFEEKTKIAKEKWDALTLKQKEDVYSMLEIELKSKIKLMNKLVEYGVMEKEDVTLIKAHMMAKFNKIKESGEFPLLRQNCNKKSK